ncbi:hypothetical protein TCAL_00145 [Tigriopus californicus]|uniref:Uncharacterized protein n=1 Tax=Tigriopus californicus TaxID=6832 RepID=A0A553PI86_TIGCA|nr:hypothetical protein TCAL_00145 [Tigriopus californicus]|eukprot:TCALIF_00145-PA protein Name:"Similar to DCAF6 DDB1- and CUL4-associated factor 6 (Homo sapiens)" AED:0.04 eAED:0.04 QI:208/1/0.85/1/1/1/7/258/835
MSQGPVSAQPTGVFHWLQGRPWGQSGAGLTLGRAQVAKGSRTLLQNLTQCHTLDSHHGCVNTLAWNAGGQWLLSGSDDHRLVITDPFSRRVISDVLTAHRANIFSAQFLPHTSDARLVSAAGDGILAYTHVERATETRACLFNCHHGTAYEILTWPGDPHTFLSCGEDGTVRWFDLRIKDRCDRASCQEDVLIAGPDPVTAMAMDPVVPYRLAVGSSDSAVRLFDRRMLGTRSTGQTQSRSLAALLARFIVPELRGKHRRITAVDFRPDGREILASYSSDYVYIFDPQADDAEGTKRLYVGQRPVARPSTGRARNTKSPPPMKRLRLRGDWSDTGPNARPETNRQPPREQRLDESEDPTLSDTTEAGETDLVNDFSFESLVTSKYLLIGPSVPVQSNLMQRMTDALSRMLNDPSTRRAMRSLNTNRDRILLAAAQRESSQPTITEEAQLPSDDSDSAVTLHPDASSLANEPLNPDNSETVHSLSTDDQSPQISADTETHDIESVLVESAPPLSAPSDIPEPRSDPPNVADLPDFRLRYGHRGTDVSSISLGLAAPEPVAEYVTDLPGPSQVVTDPGVSVDFNPPSTDLGQAISDELVEYEEEIRSSDEDSDEDEQEERSLSPLRCSASNRNVSDSSNNFITKRPIRQPKVRQKFSGHRNSRTMIKEATWWGNDFVLSGSDCGHVFGWERSSGKLVLLLEADRHVVNCIQPHPFDPILATSGIDYDVKIWTPQGDGSGFNQEVADNLVRRNEVMLEETRDTITVPAALMIRMLASLNQIRRAGRILPQILERGNNATEEQFVSNPTDESSNQDNLVPGGNPDEQVEEMESSDDSQL